MTFCQLYLLVISNVDHDTLSLFRPHLEGHVKLDPYTLRKVVRHVAVVSGFFVSGDASNLIGQKKIS
jgi:hypothetical protein